MATIFNHGGAAAAGTHYDGDHNTPFLCAAPLYWRDQETTADMTQLRFRVRKGFYRKLERGSTDSRAVGYLVDQPKPRIVGGDIYEYDLIFATVPDRPDEPIDYVMNYWYILQGGTDGPGLAEVPVPLTAIVSWRYVRTSNPKSIKLKKAYRAVGVGGGIVFVGTEPPKGAKTWLAEDETLNRWREGGDIWEIKTITVPAPDFVHFTG